MAGKRKQHTAAFKAQVALAALKGDRTANELAAVLPVTCRHVCQRSGPALLLDIDDVIPPGLNFTLLLLVARFPMGALAMLSFLSRPPSNLGIVNGRLAACPASPNCVCTQAEDSAHRMEPIPFSGSSEEALVRLKAVIGALPRSKIVTVSERYIHAEFTSRLFRFVDDVEFLIDPATKTIHFRSASRLGRSDFGVNRRRMEEIRQKFDKE